MPHDVLMPRTGRPPTTSRPEILHAARGIIDRDGWQKLTIRRLATELGVGATTIYHHVRDKQDLLVQVLDYYADRIERPELPADPRERILVAATTMHDAIAAWPQVAELLTTDDLMGESALWMIDAIVGGAIECGRTPEQAAELYRGIWYYTIGEILVRANAGRRAEDDRPRYRDTVFENLDASQYPNLAVLGEATGRRVTARDTFGHGLRALVDGLLAAQS